MAKQRKGEGVAVFEFHIGKKYIQTDRYGNVIHALIEGHPADPTRPDLLTPAERVELTKGVETDRQDYFHSRYLDLEQNDPRFQTVKSRMQRHLDPHDAVLADSDPEAFATAYDSFRGKVGRSDEEREAAEAREARAKELQTDYLAGRAGLGELAELIDLRGTGKAIQPEKPESDEGEDPQRYYDEAATDAILERNEYRREVLEEKARSKQGLNQQEVEEILALRENAPVKSEDGSDE